MKELAAATIVAKNYLSHARVLATSFHRFHPEIPFIVLLADDVDGRFDPREEPFTLLTLDEVGIPQLRDVRFQYTQQELSYAATPYLISALLDQGFARVAYFKQESLVTGDLTPVLELTKQRSIVLTPHLLDPLTGADRIDRELNILQSGVYNVGFLGVSGTPAGRAFLSWWSDRTHDHCVHDVPRGLHFEQRWLDLVPAYFDDWCYVRDRRFNVGHWNLPERIGEATFIRFSGFDPDRAEAITRYTSRLGRREVGEMVSLFDHYAQRLRDAGYDKTKSWPYAYGSFRDGLAVPQRARSTWRALSNDARLRFRDPWDARGPGSFASWFEQHDRQNRGMRGLIKRALGVYRTNYRRGGLAAGLLALLHAVRLRLVSRAPRE